MNVVEDNEKVHGNIHKALPVPAKSEPGRKKKTFMGTSVSSRVHQIGDMNRLDKGQWSTDGVTGQFRPQPSAGEPSRVTGQGLSGIEIATHVDRSTQIEEIRDGKRIYLHSWELVTAVDGPGTRMTIFLSGCPLRCLYCHNPDTMEMRRGELVQLDELLARVSRYRRIFDRTGGGITLSGGEPLMQPEAVSRIFQYARSQGIHTALDTSGHLGWRCSDDTLKNLDLCLLDIKSGDEPTHQQVTGRELQPTIDFAGRLADAGVEVWVRFVLVPGLTDSTENITKVARIAAAIPTCSRVEVLPFHQMGREKWNDLGMDYQLADVVPPSAEATEDARQIFRYYGLETY